MITAEQAAQHAADLEYIRHADGLFVGILDAGELCAFERLVIAGLARRKYEGAAGFIGLAKVELL